MKIIQKPSFYLVGGAVRDQLLGRHVKDRDWVVVGASPEWMLEQGFRPVGKDFPVFLHPDTQEEYALARTERKTAKGYHGFQFYTDTTVTLEQDLARRDLTINAMAQTESGVLIDPYQGLDDLTNKLLRHVSSAFAEDPVRILRVARFAARYAPLGFTVAPETMHLMQAMVQNGEVAALVPERVWQEMEQALSESMPARFIEVLHDCGALAIIFPALERLFGVPQKAEFHPEIDCGIHTLMVLQAACILTTDPKVRFAALVHDLGKGLTPQTLWPAHTGHELISKQLVTEWCERYRVPSHYQQLAELVAEFHGQVHKCLSLSASELVQLLVSTDALRRPERFEALLIACEADSKGRLGFEHTLYPQRHFLQQALYSCQQVNVQNIIRQGFKGEAIRQQLYLHYEQALNALIVEQKS
ncbi:MAG: multifunctional CCA addition/repair protein [Thiofilum sp.]|uniref:multifunctional CCA addition/repair protein n=1 Tax=Thiofilum sp. TaxID=2212733 RepID=UPI0025E5DCF7|nr:multifunctional CCA addition/repair protein [Thiofilum sp.]MBK8452093.1 multifunctional CCA addition/repair protein [Thiofilum sp.]